jgi:hypothetical protein
MDESNFRISKIIINNKGYYNVSILHNFQNKLFYSLGSLCKIRGNVKMGFTEDPYGRITKEASTMVSNRLIVYMVTVSCPEWKQYIFHKLRHFQMSGEIFELDVIEAVNKVDWILANKKLKVIQLQPRISKEIRCFKDGKYYGHPHRILRDTITADLSPTLDCHIYLLSPNRDFQSVMFKVRYCLERYRVGRSVTLFECEVDTLVKAVRYTLTEPDQNFGRDICPRCDKRVIARNLKWLRLPGSDKGVCYNCYASILVCIIRGRN